jgi:hypothetical protein
VPEERPEPGPDSAPEVRALADGGESRRRSRGPRLARP